MFSRELWVRILLWYNVVSLAIWAGGTLYQMIVIVPIWSADPPQSLQFFKGSPITTTILHFFGPVTQVLRAVPLFLLVALAWKYESIRYWVAACGAALVIGVVMTRAYIYPMNDVLFFRAGEGLTAERARALVRAWIIADRIRFAIMTGGWLCLLRAFSLPLG